MRKEIIEILRKSETESRNPFAFQKNPTESLGPDSSYEDYVEAFKIFKREHLLTNDCDTFLEEVQESKTVRQYMDFPNFAYIIRKIEQTLKDSAKTNFIEGSVLAELKRMEADGLVLIGTQDVREYVVEFQSDFSVKLYGEGWDATTQSIVLTTKGRSRKDYLLYQIEEQKFAVLALIVSIIALFTSFQ